MPFTILILWYKVKDFNLISLYFIWFWTAWEQFSVQPRNKATDSTVLGRNIEEVESEWQL